MTEPSVEWHADFVLDSTGDLLLSSGDDETRQRLERRLFTAVQGYVWHPEYGAGLPQKIGDPWSLSQIRSIVNSQIGLEDSVAPNPPVQVVFNQDPNQPSLISIGIHYWSAKTGVAVSFTVTI